MSEALRISQEGFLRANRALERFANFDRRRLLDAVGFEVENQTRQRIAEEKKTPEGKPWQPWTPKYAKTRSAGQSLLQGGGDLLESITYAVDTEGEFVDVGSNLVYAAIQDRGGKPNMAPGPAAIPARTFLGVSEENRRGIAAVANDFLESAAREAFH